MDLKTKLQAIFKGEYLDDATTKETYSKDASIFEITPQAILCPQDSADIQNLVQFVHKENKGSEQKLSITPRSAGTDMSGGAVNDSLIIDMTKHFNKVLEVGEDYAITQPGVFYRDFEPQTLAKGLLLPCYTASRELNTVGGMVANNSAGEKTLSYGQTERYVAQLKVIFSDGKEYLVKPLTKAELDKKIAQKDFEGNIYKGIYELIEENYDLIQKKKPQVSKNSAGYYLWNVWDRQTFDLTKLIVGSQGTIGVVTEIKFKLVKPTTHSELLVVFMKDLDNLGTIVNKILEFHPESFESYDDYTMKVATKFLPEVLKVMKPKNIIKLGIQFIPEMWMALVGGLPKLVMIAEFTGHSEEEVQQKCKEAQKAIEQFKLKTRITVDREEAKKYWTVRRESFNLLRHHTDHMRTAPFIDDIVVKPDVLPEFLPKLREILSQYNLIYTIAGHIGNGNFHIIPLMDFTKPETAQIIPELSTKVYNLLFQYNGSMTGEHNDGMVRGPYLEKMFGSEMYQLFKNVKEIFDPENIFNPHKKIDATFDYSFSHLAQNHQNPHTPNS